MKPVFCLKILVACNFSSHTNNPSNSLPLKFSYVRACRMHVEIWDIDFLWNTHLVDRESLSSDMNRKGV